MNSITNLLPELQRAYTDISFEAGTVFKWSPKDRTITYTSHQANADHGVWALFHEIAHAELQHDGYKSDFSLLQLEVAAWQHAVKVARRYGIEIDKEHAQDCIDTYRDWLHKRATCPTCSVVSIQRDDGVYQCFNCRSQWRVPRSPLCRVIRAQVAA